MEPFQVWGGVTQADKNALLLYLGPGARKVEDTMEPRNILGAGIGVVLVNSTTP